ncbi:hypothetical protein B5G13_08650 [Butyricimonas sp. An62]|nr:MULTISPECIES: site-specific integrase [Butyricimonas]OUN66494.1 hypothetical protein B5G13_08650 [Butyricimonas sp. An62]
MTTLKSKILQHYNEIAREKGFVSVDYLKSSVLGQVEQKKQATLLQHFDKFLVDMESRVNIDLAARTLGRYRVTRDRACIFIKETCGTPDLPLEEINYSLVEKFYLFIREKYNSENNNALKYVQRLKTVINDARANSLMTSDPFVNFKFKFEKKRREILTDDEIIRLMEKTFTIERLERVRDFYIFSVFTGYSHADIKDLKETDVVKFLDGKQWINTNRNKTGVSEDVPLLTIPSRIIQKYKGEGKEGRLFNIPSNQKINAYLKEIADLCGISKKLTFHTARHTFATTITLNRGIPIEVVSKLLGHTNIQTTQIYAHVLKETVSAKMQELGGKLDIFNDHV